MTSEVSFKGFESTTNMFSPVATWMWWRLTATVFPLFTLLKLALCYATCIEYFVSLDHRCNKIDTLLWYYIVNCVCKRIDPGICTIHRYLPFLKCRYATAAEQIDWRKEKKNRKGNKRSGSSFRKRKKEKEEKEREKRKESSLITSWFCLLVDFMFGRPDISVLSG